MTPVGCEPAQIDYRLGRGYGCGAPGVDDRCFSDHADGRERPLRWIGRGLAELGIRAGSELTPEQFPVARALMNGLDPRTGEVLVEPKKAVHEDAKVALAPLLRAIDAVAREADVAIAEVLGNNSKLLRAFAAAERAVASKGESARLRADEAGALADAAALHVEDVWGEGVYRRAAANLFEIRTDMGEDGIQRERRAPRRRVVGNAGYDITFTVPKSYSLLLAFADPEAAATVEEIYLQQVKRSFGWLEATTAYGMRGKHGDGRTATTVRGSGFLGWMMIHRAARPVNGAEVGDPHWHVHLTIANMTRGEDGKWSTAAAGGRDLMRHVPVVDHMVQALVRHELSTRLGVRFEWNTRTSKWEIAGIPDTALRQFSKRNADIRHTLIKLGYDPDAASRAQQLVAEQRTRGAKGESVAAADVTLQHLWQGEERDAGRDPAEHVRRVFDSGHALDEPAKPQPEPVVTVESIAASLLDPSTGLTAHSRRFTRADALRRVADAMPGGYASPAAIETMTDKVLAHLGFLELPAGGADLAGRAGRTRSLAAEHMRNAQSYTTTDVVDAEKVILRAAMASGPDQSSVRIADPELLDLAIGTVEATQGYPLSDEQRAALLRLVTTGRMVDAVEGAPGTGKTTLMRALRVVLEAAGFVVAGAATAAVAALNLQTESGIRSRTVASLLLAIRQVDTAALTGVDVLVIDEANLTNDRDRAVLYQCAAQTGTRIIEVGDSHQLRGVGVGSLFGRVRELVDGTVLRDNRRQAEEDEREAIAAWREARYAEALSIWAGKGRLVATETSGEATAAMLAKWWELRQGAPDSHTEIRGLVMLGATNQMVRRLNDAAQALRLAERELGEGRTYALAGGGTQRLHIGDHILMRTNAWSDRQLADVSVLNGYRAVVRGLADDGTITAEWQHHGPDGLQTHTAHLSSKYVAIGGIDLGYAMTVHKSEGLTVGDQWTLPDGEQSGATVLFHAVGANNPAAHVATSRHTGAVWLFAAREELENEQETLARGIPTTRAERVDRAVEKLAERARATETSPDDLPVVVQLGLPEFQIQADSVVRQVQCEAEEQRERDAEAARREARRRHEERAERTAERQAEEDRPLTAAALLLREVWRHEPNLVEAIITSAKFDAVARTLADVQDSALDVREVLAEVPLDTVASAGVSDKAAFTAWSINDAADRIRSSQTEFDRDLAARRREFELMRDQATDLLREAWSTRPELAEAVIASPAFDAVVRGLDQHTTDGLDPRDLLAKVPLRKLDDHGIRDKGAFTAYSLHRVAAAEAHRIEQEQRFADRASAERHRRRIATEHLRTAWPQHPDAAERVIAGPAFGVLATRIEQAAEADVDVHRALAAVSPHDVAAPWVRNPSAYTTVAFDRAAQRQLTDRETTPSEAIPTSEPEATQPQQHPHWTEREHGQLDDASLQRAIETAQQAAQRLAAERAATEQTTTELRAQVHAHTGPEVQAVEANLAQLRQQALAVREADRIEKAWHASIARAVDAAGERGRVEHERGGLGRLARSRHAELTQQADRLREVEEHAQREATALARQAAALHERTGPPEQRRQILVRAAAAEQDAVHARDAAHRRDLDAAATAERRLARLIDQHDKQLDTVVELRAEQQLRARLLAVDREIEQRDRVQNVQPAPAGHTTGTPQIGHRPQVDDIEQVPRRELEPPPLEL